MKILAIDSSGLVASVAILVEDCLAAEYTTNFKKTHSQTLLPMLDEIVKMTGIDLKEIDVIAVAAGPGSFTGLRIGSATAKGLGLALDKPMIEVPTIDALAYNLYNTKGLICPIMDARRNQVYTGIYCFNESELEVLSQQKAVEIDKLIEEIQSIQRESKEYEKIVFLGDGVEVHQKRLKETFGEMVSFAPAHLSKQRAGAVAVLGAHLFKEGKMINARDHEPVYLRLSQAERELKEKQARNKI